MIRHRCLWAVVAVLLHAPLAAAADRDADEQALREARVGTDGPALVAFFKNRLINTADRDKIAALIKKLGDDSFDERERASSDLVAIGARAESQLREAARNYPDAEVRRRAEDLLKQLTKEAAPALLAAAARVLGARKPDGAAAVLLDYLPQAPAESVATAVCGALEAVAVKEGKADPAVVQALEDKLAVRRTAAAVALARAGTKEHLPAVRKLLEDREAKVRLRVAVALAFAKDKQAVPALIELLADLPPADGYEAEEILRALAGDKEAPEVPLGKDAAERKKCRDAWAAWWKKGADKVDLEKLAEGVGSGGVVILMRDVTPAKAVESRILEVGRDGKVRWQMEGVRAAVDVQPLPGGRVLIVESAERRITERDRKGEVVWEKKLTAAGVAGMPMGAQRLADGNTFVVTRTGVLEIDRDGKEVWSYRPTVGSVYAARKSRTGEVAIITLNGTCVCMDAKGKEMGSFPACRVAVSSGIDVLAGGNVLVPDMVRGKVVEYDAKGKVVWEATVERPSSAVRLPNGHTLVSCALAKRVVELDRDGKEVWKCDLESRPYKAYRR